MSRAPRNRAESALVIGGWGLVGHRLALSGMAGTSQMRAPG